MKTSRTKLALIIGICLCGLLNAGIIFGFEPEAVEIQLSPNVLNIQSFGDIVTVHTDLPYSIVAGASVTLNGIAISWWKSDDRGYFVAKFAMDVVKTEASLIIGNNLVVFAGETVDGVSFTGEQILKVVSIIPKKK